MKIANVHSTPGPLCHLFHNLANISSLVLSATPNSLLIRSQYPPPPFLTATPCAYASQIPVAAPCSTSVAKGVPTFNKANTGSRSISIVLGLRRRDLRVPPFLQCPRQSARHRLGHPISYTGLPTAHLPLQIRRPPTPGVKPLTGPREKSRPNFPASWPVEDVKITLASPSKYGSSKLARTSQGNSQRRASQSHRR